MILQLAMQPPDINNIKRTILMLKEVCKETIIRKEVFFYVDSTSTWNFSKYFPLNISFTIYFVRQHSSFQYFFSLGINYGPKIKFVWLVFI